jgi:hypothetical protein
LTWFIVRNIGRLKPTATSISEMDNVILSKQHPEEEKEDVLEEVI